MGAQWHNIGTGPAGDVFSLGEVSVLLLFDALLYSLATWYLEAVFPGKMEAQGTQHPLTSTRAAGSGIKGGPWGGDW